MEASMIGREYHQAGVIYVCSGCERDMLDSGNGADLHLSTTTPHTHTHSPSPSLPLSFPPLSFFSQGQNTHRTLESNLLSAYSTLLPPRCFLQTLFVKAFFSSARERAVYTNRLSKRRQIPLLRVDTNLTCEKYNGLFACCTARRETSFPCLSASGKQIQSGREASVRRSSHMLKQGFKNKKINKSTLNVLNTCGVFGFRKMKSTEHLKYFVASWHKLQCILIQLFGVFFGGGISFL